MTSGVLIVEDGTVRTHAAEFMEDRGFNVYEASNADEAIALLKSHDDIRAVFTRHPDARIDGRSKAGPLYSRTLAARPKSSLFTSGHARPLSEDMPAGCRVFWEAL